MTVTRRKATALERAKMQGLSTGSGTAFPSKRRGPADHACGSSIPLQCWCFFLEGYRAVLRWLINLLVLMREGNDPSSMAFLGLPEWFIPNGRKVILSSGVTSSGVLGTGWAAKS